MKVALCFIINYEHILNKEEIWKTWIKDNEDILNIYFYYKDIHKIHSPWIKKHCIPEKYIYPTTYYYVIPAYISIMKYAMDHDTENQWFCLLTDSCCPIVSPKRFRYMFYTYYLKSIFSWKKAWWNVDFHKRANLRLLNKEYRLGNDPWFVLKREDIAFCLRYYLVKHDTTKIICEGGLANESLFAIMLKYYKCLDQVVNYASHITDWTRMTTSTSPHLFITANKQDIQFIEKTLKENPYALFIRKISTKFPDKIMEYYIYEFQKKRDQNLVICTPFLFTKYLKNMFGFRNILYFLWWMFLYLFFYLFLYFAYYSMLH